MKIYVGITDNNWYKFLAKQQPDEVNFWQPGGKQVFRVLNPYELFLFKLHSPLNYIAGGGFFVRHSFLPVSLAWEAFGTKNGRQDYGEFRQAIYSYRSTNAISEPDPVIGCIILTQPFFWPESEWIPVPEDWKRGIQQGKSYDTDSITGRRLWNKVQEQLQKSSLWDNHCGINEHEGDRYGSEQIIVPRLGQGAFRVMVTEAYNYRCAISGEKTLPVLEAAHIKPYSQEGPHTPSNGLLLRQDIHTLFDRGYLTISEGLHVEVSKRIKEDFGNGREYYSFHGRQLLQLPDNLLERPNSQFIRWHNDNVYLG